MNRALRAQANHTLMAAASRAQIIEEKMRNPLNTHKYSILRSSTPGERFRAHFITFSYLFIFPHAHLLKVYWPIKLSAISFSMFILAFMYVQMCIYLHMNVNAFFMFFFIFLFLLRLCRGVKLPFTIFFTAGYESMNISQPIIKQHNGDEFLFYFI